MKGCTLARQTPAPRSRRVTLKDVAGRAQVSPQTVSNALRGTGRMSAETRERVLAAVDALGYRSHAGASSLRSGRANRLVYLMPAGEPQDNNPIMVDFLQHIVIAAARRSQEILVIRPEGDAVDQLDALVRGHSVDGAILSANLPGDPRVDRLHQLGAPFACLGRTDPDRPQAWVDIDNEAATRDVTHMLLRQGHRRIAFLGYRTGRRWDLAREAGYRGAVKAAGLPASITRVRAGREGPAVAALLTRKARPTAIVSGSDVLAVQCYAAAYKAGLRVGTDLAVTGFDGTTASRFLVPSLTTVAMPLTQIAERIIARILNEIPNTTGEILPTQLILGDSTGHAPSTP